MGNSFGKGGIKDRMVNDLGNRDNSALNLSLKQQELKTKTQAEDSNENLSYFINLPLESTKNNRYFHKSVELGYWQKIVKSGRIEMLHKENDYMLHSNRFMSKLMKTKIKIEKYNRLLEDALVSRDTDQGLIIEIISGHDIKGNKKRFPIVEISQDFDSMPIHEKEKIDSLLQSEDNGRHSSVTRASKITMDGLTFEQEDELRDNKVIFGTPITNISNNNRPEWSVCYRLVFNDKNFREGNKIFTIALYQGDKNKKSILQLGSSKTFNISHFRDQKVHEIPLEFKKSYDSHIKGVVLIRAQYVHNQESLFKDILSNLKRKEELIIESMNILNGQEEATLGINRSRDFSITRSLEDSKVIGAGFYSWNESEDLEKDLRKKDNELSYDYQYSYDLYKDKPLGELSQMSSYLQFSNDGGSESDQNEHPKSFDQVFFT